MRTREKRKRKTQNNVVDKHPPPGRPRQRVNNSRNKKHELEIEKQPISRSLIVNMDEEDYVVWKQVGQDQNLTTDGAIAAYLLQCYQRSSHQTGLCIKCCQLVTDCPSLCLTCRLSSLHASSSSLVEQAGPLDATASEAVIKTEAKSLPFNLMHSSLGTNAEGSRFSINVPSVTPWSTSKQIKSDTLVDKFEVEGLHDDPIYEDTFEDPEHYDNPQLSKAKTVLTVTNCKSLLMQDRVEKLARAKDSELIVTSKIQCFGERCSKVFSSFNTFLQHYLRFHCQGLGVKPEACPLCDYSVKKPYNLGRHLFLSHRPRLKREELEDAAKSYTCEFCGSVYSSRKRCHRHIRIVHKRGFMCDICGKLFGELSRLNSHMSKCLSRKCQHCGVLVPMRHSVRVHMERCAHNPDTFIKCQAEGCKRSFASKRNMVSHYLGFHGKDQYQCAACGKTYHWRRSYDKHKIGCSVARRGKDNEEMTEKEKRLAARDRLKVVKCQAENCDHRFKNKHSMQTHYRGMHAGCTQACSNCGREFKWNTSLLRHMRLKECQAFDVNHVTKDVKRGQDTEMSHSVLI